MSMNILSWSIRGLNARIKRSTLRKLIRTHSPKFTFIQESKMEECNQKVLKSLWHVDDVEWCFSPSIGNSGGIVTIWNKEYFILDSSMVERNWIAISGIIPSLNFKCCLVNIYNPCSTEERAMVWNSLTDL